MPVRTTPAQVRAITGSTLDDTSIDPFIEAANILVDRTVANGCASSLSDETLTTAETFLASHLLANSGAGESGGGGIKTKEQFENYQVEFQRAMAGDGLLGSQYGMTANALLNGCLIDLDKRQAGIVFFGGA